MPSSASPRAGRGRHIGIILTAMGALAIALPRGVDMSARDRATSLARALQERGLGAKPEDMVWVDPPRGVWGALGRSSRAIVRAAPAAGEPSDLFLVETELSPEGVLLDVGGAYNLTETSGAEESRPLVRGEVVAYVSRPLIEEASATVHVLDLGGHTALGAPDWSRIERVQSAITNYQQTGQTRGVAERVFAVEGGLDKEKAKEGEEDAAGAAGGSGRSGASGSTSVEILDFDGKVVRVRVGAGAGASDALLSLAPGAPLPAGFRVINAEPSRPPTLVQWSVDRVRAIPWVGDDTMQGIKAIAFTALDFVMRNKERVTGDTGAEDIAADLGRTELAAPTRKMQEDPEIGWPPPPLEAWVTPALPGEGQWNPRDNDPFVRRIEGLPPAFLTTFIRSDRSRKATRVYVALWDPRQVELHMMAGTVEPKSATGEAGPGLIPRTPEVMKRVVAASNAGFQALHGEFGMMADGVVYLPPKPYAATVAVLRDGSTAFGTWPEQTAPIPEFILSYRQNMTVMVQDEKFNPYGRTWWGGTVPGSEDKTHTVRTGICMTRESFVAYFYGADIGPEGLSQAMIQTRCKFGIALDMNAGHSGMEFYKVAPAAELEPLGRPLQTDWEAEGDVPGLDGWKFRGRRLIRGMGLMNFPRYIKREARDYFYYTLRHVLPGPGLTPGVTPAQEGEGAWRVKGLPQHGFPYAMATTELRPEASRPDARVRVLAIDPRTVSAAAASAAAGAGEKTVAVIDAGSATAAAGGQGEALSVWHSAGSFSIASAAPVAGAVRLATGSSAAPSAVAAAGVRDEDGTLLYVELSPRPAAPAAADAALLDAFLKRIGCSTRLLLASPLPIALGGDTDLGGAAVHPPSGPSAVRLARARAAGAQRIFEDTPVVPFDHWYKLQQHRVRYFKKPKTEKADGEGEGT
jgi:hypothetical protein